jgi:long-chain fatty acid transport protein
LLTLLDALQNSPLGGTIENLSGPLSDARYGNRLGGNNGPGFGWQNMSVVKLGVDYVWSPALTLRAGYSDTEQPVPEDETFFNILAPGVVEKHYTVGATLTRGSHEFTMHALYAPRVDVKGSGSIPGDGPPIPPTSFGGGEADIYLEEKTLGISYGYRFN